MKTKTGHKPKTLHTFKSNTRKVCCTLLVSCILFSSCGKNADNPDQDLTQGITTAAPQKTLSPAITPTKAPQPIPSDTPIPTPMPTPEPSPDWAFIPSTNEPDKTSLLDYLTPEEINTVLSFSYDPDTIFQLFARYRGWLKQPDCYYCIDLIQVDKPLCQMLVNIKILSSAYSFESSTVLQNLYYFVDASIMADSFDELFQITDFNNDGYKDFLFCFGPMGNSGRYSLGFIYDTAECAYALLGSFSSATYLPEKLLIYENIYASMGYPDTYNKYIISDAKAILSESIQALYLGNEKHSYKYQKYINGEAYTVLENASYEEINRETDLSEWALYTDLPEQ